METRDHIKKMFGYGENDFLNALEQHCILTSFQAKTEILNEGEKIRFITILIKGSIKVYALNDGKELLYYYLKPYECCIMTFSSIFTNSKSRIYVCAEESTQVLLLPVDKVLKWLVDYPIINQFFLKEYDKRYTDIMRMVTQAVYYKLDKRILDLLSRKIDENGGSPIKISHKEIAATLGTAREVVSRILKKYENEGVISQSNKFIGITKKMQIV
jgi:CRP/FNR family transcriptional regulator